MSQVTDPPPRASSVVTGVVVVAAAALWLAVLLELAVVVPAYEKGFADFRLRLPWFTEAVIAASRWVVKYWYVALIALFFGLSWVALVNWLLRHRIRSRWPGIVWCVLVLLLPLLLFVGVWVVCHVPLLQLEEGLRK